MQYKVAKGRSIMLPPTSTLPAAECGMLKEGQIIPDGLLTKNEIGAKLRDGFIVEASVVQTAPAEEKPLGGTIPSSDQSEGNAAKTGSADRQPIEVQQQNGAVQTQVQTSENKPDPEQVKSPWTLDPRGLQGVDLEELQVMIIERHADENFDVEQACPTAEAAISFLSQDFKEPESN